MSNAVYPTTPAYQYPVKRTAEWKTLVQQATSGLDATAALWSYPIWHWELPYDVLDAAVGDFQTIVNFFNSRQGMFDTWLFTAPSDNVATAQSFGTGDGTTTAFQLKRALTVGGFQEPIFNVNGTPSIYTNGVLKTAGLDYSISATGLVTFTVAPVNGNALTWTGSYYFRCRFKLDLSQFENFARQLYKQGVVQFRSVKSS